MKLFSADKANILIPTVSPLIEELWAKRRELAIRLLENDPALRRGTSARSRKFTELKAEIVRLINRIEEYGCVVKDLDLGLLDFPALRDGRPIYLCWKAGEPEIGHWHGTDETFVDRKPLDVSRLRLDLDEVVSQTLEPDVAELNRVRAGRDILDFARLRDVRELRNLVSNLVGKTDCIADRELRYLVEFVELRH